MPGGSLPLPCLQASDQKKEIHAQGHHLIQDEDKVEFSYLTAKPGSFYFSQHSPSRAVQKVTSWSCYNIDTSKTLEGLCKNVNTVSWWWDFKKCFLGSGAHVGTGQGQEVPKSGGSGGGS